MDWLFAVNWGKSVDKETEEFFERYKDYQFGARYYECTADFTVEDLYQMFAKRVRAELAEILVESTNREAES